MGVQLRTPTDADWPAILRCANASLPWQAAGNELWLGNRKKFDEAKFSRRHYVAVDEGSREIVGYGSVEGDENPGRYRVFVVMDAKLLATVGEVLFARLWEDLQSLRADVAWVREEARDVSRLNFFQTHGFGDEVRFRTPDGLDLVTLKRSVGAA